MNRQREELEIERKVWSKCSQCEEEYAKGERGNIVMNMNCFHSYCKECIEQSASTSLLCPVCHSSLPTPLSSLPINYTLCYWQSLSPPLPPLLNNILNNNYKLEDEEDKKLCEDCEENKEEVRCFDCKISVCNSCADSIHSRRVMKNHFITPINSSSPSSSLSLKKSNLPLTSPIICFYQCERHNNNNNFYNITL